MLYKPPPLHAAFTMVKKSKGGKKGEKGSKAKQEQEVRPRLP